MITPADIAAKKFGSVRLKAGYDPDEVDDFLDAVAATVADANSRLASANEQLTSVRSAPTASIPKVEAPAPTFLGDVSRILAVAQETADRQVAEATAKASELVAAGEAEGRKALGEALVILDEKKAAAQAELDAVTLKLNDVKAREEAARTFLTQHLTALQGQLAAGSTGEVSA